MESLKDHELKDARACTHRVGFVMFKYHIYDHVRGRLCEIKGARVQTHDTVRHIQEGFVIELNQRARACT